MVPIVADLYNDFANFQHHFIKKPMMMYGQLGTEPFWRWNLALDKLRVQLTKHRSGVAVRR